MTQSRSFWSLFDPFLTTFKPLYLCMYYFKRQYEACLEKHEKWPKNRPFWAIFSPFLDSFFATSYNSRWALAGSLEKRWKMTQFCLKMRVVKPCSHFWTLFGPSFSCSTQICTQLTPKIRHTQIRRSKRWSKMGQKRGHFWPLFDHFFFPFSIPPVGILPKKGVIF